MVAVTQPLRAWQRQALTQFTDTYPRDFLVTATPGAGKTTFGLALARDVFNNKGVRRLIVVTPTDHLRNQWVSAAADAGFDLRATPNRERLPKDADGVVATYAQVAQAPAVFDARCRTTNTVVLFDELHHAGDQNSWGEGLVESFEHARHRIGITGTPFRSDNSRIPHVTYQQVPPPADPGTLESVADFTYGYREALQARVVRPVVFASYSGSTSWSSRAGETYAAMLGDPTLTRSTEEQAWKAALSPDGEWIGHVFAAMEHRLTELRARTIPDAAALVLASNQDTARAYADVWESVNGYRPALILSDDPAASDAIHDFRDDPDAKALIAVRMVSEGVDVPRAAVLGFATTASTPLFFAQAVGRVVRARRRGETATVFLPAVTRLLGLAAAMETERNHVLAPPAEGDDLDVPVPDPAPDSEDGEDEKGWDLIEATASFHDVISGAPYDDDEEGTLPGLLTPEQEAALLAKSDEQAREAAKKAARARAAAKSQTDSDRAAAIRHAQVHGGLNEVIGKKHVTGVRIESAGDEAAALRRVIADRVRRKAGSVRRPPQELWGDLYRAVPGPKNSAAPVKVLQARADHTESW